MDGEAAPASNAGGGSYLYFENVTNHLYLAHFTFHCQALYAWMERQPQLVMQAVGVVAV